MSARRLTFLIFMLACCGVFCALGTWQIKRLHWKENLIAEMEQAYASPAEKIITPDKAAALKEGEYLRGLYTGLPEMKKAFELSGQIDDGKPSKHLLVPFQLTQELTILVDMGPEFTPPGKANEPVTIQGVLRHAPLPNRFTPANDPDKNIWYRVDPQQLKITGLKPLILMPEKTPWKDYPAHPPELRNQHLQYAIFWFTMAGLIFLLTLLSFRKKQD